MADSVAVADAPVAAEQEGSGETVMKVSDFISQLDEKRIVEAIRQAESRTTGEIRVFISRRHIGNAMDSARAHFRRLRMDQTPHRNAVLIFIAPRARKFAVIGDDAIHHCVGDVTWWHVVSGMEHLLKTGHCTDAVLSAVQEVGRALAQHFPAEGDRRNELPDHIAKD